MKDLTELQSLPAEPIELKKLSPKHQQVAALLAQGVDRRTIAAACDYTPEYVTWLQRQPLFMAYVKEMNVAVAVRLEALFTKSVDVINETMENGGEEARLKAAKLQLEATGRVGRFQTVPPEGGGTDRLEQLSERLLDLLKRQRSAVYDQDEVTEATVVSETASRGGR